MRKVFLILLLCIGIAGCGQIYDREPVGIGFDNNELKMSPCACIRVLKG